MKETHDIIKSLQRTAPKKIHLSRLNIALIAVLTATTAFSIGFFPVLGVNINKSYDVPRKANVDRLRLNLTTDVAVVNIRFKQLEENMVTLNTSVTGRTGVFAGDLFNMAFDPRYEENVLVVTSRFDTSGRWPWYEPGWLKAECNVCIDTSLNTSIDVTTRLGNISIETQAGVVLEALDLESYRGNIEAKVSRDTVIAGNVTIKGTANVELLWEDVTSGDNVSVELEGGTREPENPPWALGNVTINLKQTNPFAGNITLRSESTIGDVNFNMAIRNGAAAKIQSTSLSGTEAINIINCAGFVGYTQTSKSPLTSNNYPAQGNFDVVLKTDTGNIHIDSAYRP